MWYDMLGDSTKRIVEVALDPEAPFADTHLRNRIKKIHDYLLPLWDLIPLGVRYDLDSKHVMHL